MWNVHVFCTKVVDGHKNIMKIWDGSLNVVKFQVMELKKIGATDQPKYGNFENYLRTTCFSLGVSRNFSKGG